MPKLGFGVQKLLNSWVNVNKDHYSRAPPSSSSLKQSSSGRKHRSNVSRSSKKFSDDNSIVTASTASTSLTTNTLSSLSSLSATSEFKGGLQHVTENEASLFQHSGGKSEGISLQELNFEERLKRGTFGATYKGTWEEKCVTIKVATPVISTEEWNQVTTRLISLQGINSDDDAHKYFVDFLGTSVLQPTRIRGTGGEIHCLVSEYVQGTTLTKSIDKKNVSLESRWNILRKIARGMEILHSFDIIHGNLKPENILVRKDEIRIADYGIAKFLKKQDEREQEQNPYMSVDKSVTKSSDIYSFAVIARALISSKHPKRSAEKIQYDFPKEINSSLTSLLKRCLHENPQERPTFATIVEALEVLSAESSDAITDEVIKNANDKMAQLSMKDNSGNSNKSLLSKLTSSKKNRFLKRAPPLKTSKKDASSYANADQETMTTSQRKRLLRFKRPKRSKNKYAANKSMLPETPEEGNGSTTQILNESDEEEVMSTGTDTSTESMTSIERGAPPYKKHAFFRYSYAPEPRAGMVVPQGVQIEHSHVASGVPLVQPTLLANNSGPPIPKSIDKHYNINPDGDVGAMFFFDHNPASKIQERPIMKLRRHDSEPHSLSEKGTVHRRASSANNFVIGRSTVLEYVPSIATPVLNPPFPTMNSMQNHKFLTYNVHAKNVDPSLVLSTILETQDPFPMPVSSNERTYSKDLSESDTNKITMAPTLCSDIPGISMPVLGGPLSNPTVHQEPLSSSSDSETTRSSIDVEMSTSNVMQASNEDNNSLSIVDDDDARLDAAAILYSQFSAQRSDKPPLPPRK